MGRRRALSQRTQPVNHRPSTDERALSGDETVLAPGFSLPAGFRVGLLGERPGWGEDDPLYSMRQERDGWRIATEIGRWSERPGSDRWVSFDPPGVDEKLLRPKGPKLRVTLHGLKERDGRWYVQSTQVVALSGEVLADLGRTDWADVDHNGDVLYAKEGRLFRIRRGSLKLTSSWEPKLVADLNDLCYQRVEAPGKALVWPKSARSAGIAKR